ncbi:MAG: DUF2256 domain-containing protein [Verrucomicrobiota bacterium]|nr:hypothetical protein [Verrucomicrobiales bacterium]MED5456276.1 DUF2256 domain-containing protein [Verrucomicrobiota bacterium]MEE2724978.1 DUF2256 domain-containing protein [Verrucomicrobiota bacterium]
MIKPKKKNLPYKICIACNRSFSWRKKWTNNWEFVKYCSKRCANHSRLRRN